MITRREACFVILTVALSSVSALHCPTNQKCICQQITSYTFKINCTMKNNSAFIVYIYSNMEEPEEYWDEIPNVTIECINSPDWSDFHLDVTTLTKNENIKWLSFLQCDLPRNNSLGEIAQILGATDVESLNFGSNKNMNFAVVKHHLDDFKNLKHLRLWINNSYVDKDLLSGLINLTELSLKKTNNLHLVAEFFNYTPELKRLYLIDNALRSIELGSFDNLKNLELLSLTNNNLTELQSGIFDELDALKTLDLNTNNMVKLPENIFAKLENLEIIQLSENKFTYLPKNLLRNNAKLATVLLFNNKRNMTTLPNEFFANLTKLIMLDLSANGFVTLPENLFWGCTSLLNINLKLNYLQTLPKYIFRDLKELRELQLNFNAFVTLPDHIFSNTNQLINLDLSKITSITRNISRLEIFPTTLNMTTLPNKFFANLTKLIMLDLSANGFVTLPEDLFWGCTTLTRINLELNYLQTLPKHIFRDLKELKELYLNSNDFATLPDYIFWNTNQLIKLDLSKNRITSISRHLFVGLHALEELNMEENRLITISNYGFSSLKELKIVKLSKNYLMLYENPHKRERTPFSHCVSLEELYLAHNNISVIFTDWLYLFRLRKLDLKYNDISYITTEDVQFLSDKITVDLTHNKIKRIILNNAERFMKYQDTRDTIILVDDNPLHCDCWLYDFLRYIEGKIDSRIQNYFRKIPIKPGYLTCQSPKELKNVRVRDLKSENLTCAVDPSMCSEKCNCFVRPENNAFIFDCSHRKLTSVPNDIPINDRFRFELKFSGNWLTRMPDLKAMKLESVKNLTLSHNSITEISLDGLSSTIEVLELHNNNVSRIHPDVLKFLKQSTNLTQLTLHENPWECDCDAKEFQSFIQNPRINVKIPDLLNVKCVGTNISVSDTFDFCAVNMTMIIGVSTTISFWGFFIGFIGLYYKYQRQIKVWLFAHQWCLWFVTEKELDKEKLYDAFVSYSHKDDDFVVNELVPRLENGSTPFKLCLHYRDWLAGEWIPANIANSVENSRRTIVVLSPNFLESIWGRMEFRTAHSQALNEGRARVILILYGDIGPIDNLDPELKAYISMNTYVKWGDPWFWDKLKYALPHQPKL